MKVITIPEFGRIDREEIGERAARRLELADRDHDNGRDQPVFDWSRRSRISAKNYVGVIQVPGLAVQIVPKVDGLERGEDNLRLAGKNLLVMLSVSGTLPVHARDIAEVGTRRLSLLDAFIASFCKRLVGELRRGVDHGYVRHREQSRSLRGRLCLKEQVLYNSVRRERFFVEFDEFVMDTRLNQILKWACNSLSSLTRTPSNRRRLSEAMSMLGDVDDLDVRPHHFDEVHTTRNTDRFVPLLDFCRLLLASSSPEPIAGGLRSFSLLFPMEVVFERYVAALVRRYSTDYGVDPTQVHAQGRGVTRWLLRQHGGNRRINLCPDIVITDPDGRAQRIVDTKWKASDGNRKSITLSTADVYQLYAYANRYESPDNVLLFPRTAGAETAVFGLEGDDSNRVLRTAFLDVGRDLLRDGDAVRRELQAAIVGKDVPQNSPCMS